MEWWGENVISSTRMESAFGSAGYGLLHGKIGVPKVKVRSRPPTCSRSALPRPARSGGWPAEVEGDTRQRKSTPREGVT